MKKIIFVLVGLAMSSIALAGPSSYAEFALITGGENNSRNSSGKENGFEFAGAWAFNDSWYVGGIAGEYDQRADSARDWTYFNVNGGYVRSLNPKTDLTLFRLLRVPNVPAPRRDQRVVVRPGGDQGDLGERLVRLIRERMGGHLLGELFGGSFFFDRDRDGETDLFLGGGSASVGCSRS